jgi:mitochondrial fission protein ELM1
VLRKEVVENLIETLINTCEKLSGEIFLTTSRRTAQEVEEVVKMKLQSYSQCRLQVIANETNIEGAVGGILGLSDLVVVTGESISMVSEAASAGKYVIVFPLERKRHFLRAPVRDNLAKHERFLASLAKSGHIFLTQPEKIGERLKETWEKKPPPNVLNDSEIIAKAVEKLI